MDQPGKERVIEEQSIDEKQWKEWERQGDWRPRGWKLVEIKDGPTLNDLTPQKFLVVQRPHALLYSHSYGNVSQFFWGVMKDKKLLGTKCPKCELVFCPPRAHCFNPDCKNEETSWVELPMEGEVHTYTIMAIAWPAMAHLQPLVGVFVRIKGVNTCLPMIMKEIDPMMVYIGLKVKINIVDKPQGDLLDVYATPAEEPHPPERSEKDRVRLETDLQGVTEWVKKRFGEKPPDK